MNKVIYKISPFTKIFAIATLFIAFVGGAAMALEPAVKHTGLGIVAWSLSFVFVAAWVIFALIEHFSVSLKQWKEGEKGLVIYVTTYTVSAVIMLVIITTSLAIH